MFANLKILLFIDVCLGLGLLLCRHALLPHLKGLIGPRIAVLLLLTPAVALFCGNLFLFYFYLAGAVAFAGRDRATVGAAFLLLLPTVPPLVSTVGFAGIYLMPFSSILFVTVGALLGILFTRGRMGSRYGAYDMSAVMLVLLFSFMDARGENFTSTLRILLYFTMLLGAPYYVISRCLNGREQIERALFHLCVAGVGVACVGIYEGTRNWVLYQNYYPALHLPMEMGSAMTNVRGGRLRVPGPPVDATAFGYMLVVMLCAFPSVRHFFRRKWYRILLCVIGFCLLLTQARGDWLGGVVAWIVMNLYRGRTMRAVAGVTVGVVGQIILPIILASGSNVAETLGRSGSGASTVEYRRQLLDTGIEQVKQHPLIGQNPIALMKQLSGLEQGQHIIDIVNTHLYIAMTAGLPGLFLWFGVWLMMLGALFKRRRAFKRAGYDEIGRTAVGVVAAAMVILAFTSTIDRNLTWLVVMLAVTAASVRQVSRWRVAVAPPPDALPEPALPEPARGIGPFPATATGS